MVNDPAARHSLVGPADLWEMKRQFQIDFLRRAGLMPSHELLDFGCGTLRGGIPLIEYLQPGHYTGVEVRREVLEEGRRELEESGLTVKRPCLVSCDDLASLDLGRRFDVAWAFAVLIHLDDGILDEALGLVRRHLQPTGVFYATVNVGEKATGAWQGFPIVFRSLDFYRDAFRRHGLAVEDIGSLPTHGHLHPRASAEDQERQRMLRAVVA